MLFAVYTAAKALSMLINFSLTNYKTFRERTEWSMVATDDTTFEGDNVAAVPEFELRLLKSAVVYGANASGKSNLLRVLGLLKSVIRGLLKAGPDEPFPMEPFRLNPTAAAEPSEMEIIFLASSTRYRYGFEADATHVVAEWLFIKKPEQEVEIEVFYRNGQAIELPADGSPQLRYLRDADVVRKNELLLLRAAENNSPEATRVYEWFRGLNLITALDTRKYRNVLIAILNDSDWAPLLLELVQAADLSITAAVPDMLDLDNLPDDMPADAAERMRAAVAEAAKPTQIWRDVRTQHLMYNDDQQPQGHVWFQLQQEESHGTLQFFTLMALILDTLRRGGILAVDELETALHPQLVRKIVSLFHSPIYNPHGAQLLFSTHDTNLLAADSPFRRDQIWFTEKDKYGAAKLYSLADFDPTTPAQPGQPVRFDHLERDYLNGRYGAVPFLGRFGYAEVAVDKGPTNHG